MRVLAIITIVAATGCAEAPTTVLESHSEARRLTAEALVQFTKAADAANRVVMAGTDEAATASVREADQATTAVQSNIDRLRPILDRLGYSSELHVLDEFAARFSDYRDLDRKILGLMADSSNLKAQRLSFGPAQQEADALRDALQSVEPLAPADTQSRVVALSAMAVSSVREIQALQAPHIAEPDDDQMTRIEKRMAASESDARRALTTIAGLVPSAALSKVTAAASALDRFLKLNAEILTLSRRNSNVHALALSLGQKRKLVAACEESLRALQDALAKRGFSGTR